MREWVISVFSLVMISVLSGYIIPEGKLNGFLKGLFSIIISIAIVSPVLKIDFSNFSFENATVEIPFQKNYIEFIFDKKTEYIKENVKKVLEGYDCFESVTIEYEIDKFYNYVIKKVVVDLNNSVINSNEEHIDIIEDVKEKVLECVQIGKDLIKVV